MDAELRAEIEREMERLEDLVVDLRAENERLRGSLGRLEKIGDKTPVDIGLVSLIAKEALK